MWQSVAADLPVQPETTGQLPVLIFGLVGTIAVVLGGIAVALINSRANQSAPSPPAANVTETDMLLSNRIAVLERRADDSDDRDEIQDRTLSLVIRALDIKDPRWLR